jgi:hypothetical protein
MIMALFAVPLTIGGLLALAILRSGRPKPGPLPPVDAPSVRSIDLLAAGQDGLRAQLGRLEERLSHVEHRPADLIRAGTGHQTLR